MWQISVFFTLLFPFSFAFTGSINSSCPRTYTQMHFPLTNEVSVDTDEGRRIFWHSSFPKTFHQSSDVGPIVTDGSMHLSTIKQNIYSKCIVITETPVQNSSENTHFWSSAALSFPWGDRTEMNKSWWGCNTKFSKAFFGCFLAMCVC